MSTYVYSSLGVGYGAADESQVTGGDVVVVCGDAGEGIAEALEPTAVSGTTWGRALGRSLASTITARGGGGAVTWKFGGVETGGLVSAGGVDGVQIAFVAALNGEGRGSLWYEAGGLLRWQAPESETPGAAIDVSAGGTFTLLDGDDEDKFVRVTVDEDFLPTYALQAGVELTAAGENDVAGPRISAADAAAGQVATWQLTVHNADAVHAIADVYFWFEEVTDDGPAFELSTNNADWYSPSSEVEAVALMPSVTIAAAGSRTLYLRRTTTAGQAAGGAFMLDLRVSGEDRTGSARLRSAARGFFSIQNTAEYRFYRKLGSPPVPGTDAAFATAASLPATPAIAWADGSWYTGVTYFNGHIESGLDHCELIVLSSGAQTATPPDSPVGVEVQQLAAGVTRILALYNPMRDSLPIADEWRIWYTTNGSTPVASGSPQVTQAMTFERGAALLSYDLPAQVNGTTVKVLVKASRSSGTGLSLNSEIKSNTAKTTGPAAALLSIVREQLGKDGKL